LSARSGRTPAAAAKPRFAQACVEDVDFGAVRGLVRGCSSNSQRPIAQELPELDYHGRLQHRQNLVGARSATTPCAEHGRDLLEIVPNELQPA
jgi:hypothetical protein